MIQFPIGVLAITSGAAEALIAAGGVDIASMLVRRHASGDWGEVDEHDRLANDHAIEYGNRLVSQYTLATGEKIWIITEADRSATTLLLPGEY